MISRVLQDDASRKLTVPDVNNFVKLSRFLRSHKCLLYSNELKRERARRLPHGATLLVMARQSSSSLKMAHIVAMLRRTSTIALRQLWSSCWCQRCPTSKASGSLSALHHSQTDNAAIRRLKCQSDGAVIEAKASIRRWNVSFTS